MNKSQTDDVPATNQSANPGDGWSTTRYVTPSEAAVYLSLSKSTLAKMRLQGDGPVYIKAGRKNILYSINDLDAWVHSNRRRSTSEHKGGDPACR